MSNLPRIKVNQNGRFLITEKGDPFFFLADTAWELFHRLTQSEADRYLTDRAGKGFNVILAVALAELDGLNEPNCYGERPLHDNDPTRPNEAYFAYMDKIIQRAGELGLYIGLLPTWGDKVMLMWGKGPEIFDEKNARHYGRFLGKRYANSSNVLWILGGDRPPVSEDGLKDDRPIWRAMATGILETNPKAFLTYHIKGGEETGCWMHDEPWLHINSLQSGHGGGQDVATAWELVTQAYKRQPPKPVIDLEICYEDHPVNPWPTWQPENGYFRAWDVRRQAYRSVFSGGCGVAYGHHFIWQMWDQGRTAQNNGDELIPWQEALTRPGATQMGYLRELMLSRPYQSRIPDQSIILSPIGTGKTHIRATRDSNGRYALIYLPVNQPVTVALDWLASDTAQLSWFNPRTGTISTDTIVSTTHPVTKTPPGGDEDWVLVIDQTDA